MDENEENNELEEEVEFFDDEDNDSSISYTNYPQSQIIQPKKQFSNDNKNIVENAGKTTKNVGSTMQKAGTGMEKTGQGMQKAGKGVESAGKGVQTTGKGIQAAGKTANTTGDVLMKGGEAASATGVGAIAGVPMVAVGGAAKAVGTGTEIAGKGTEISGQAIEKSGQGMQKAGQSLEKAGTATKKAGEKVEKAGEKIEDSGKELGKVKKKVTNTLKKTKFIKKNWLLIVIVAVFLSLVIIFNQIMSPIIDNVDNFKLFIEGITDFAEKSGNMYSGLGFKTNDEAFYEELSDQYNLSNGEVDLALVMSALMYTETTNDYTTDFSDSGEEKSVLDSLNEIVQEYTDTSKYTQGQILRARMLCKGMTEEAEGEKVTFDEFLKQYGNMLDINAKNLGESFNVFALPGIFLDIGKNIINAANGPTYATVTGEQANSLMELFDTATMGLKSITTITVESEEILDENGNTEREWNLYVTMVTKKYSEDKFKTFLSSYIKKMPEFKSIIDGLEGTILDDKIDSIINEIYEHKIWYTSIYGDIEVDVENYDDSCIGAISNDLVPELTLPVKINSASVTFSGEYAFGVNNGQMHNGVDLNSETTGTKEGDSVFAISIGEVVKVSKASCNKNTDESCDANGTYIKLKHSKMIDGTKYNFYSVYANLQSGSVTLKKGDKVKKGDVIGKAGKTGDAVISQVHFEFHNEDDTPIDPTNLFIECTSGDLYGDTNEEKIWFYFRNLGYSEVATAAAMGNLKTESTLESQIVQGDIPMSNYSIDYTNNVDSGKISRNDFVNNGPGGGGYGLAQWTSPGRKNDLYSYKKKEKTSIGDLQMQLGYLMTEINGSEWTSSKYKNTWKNASKLSQLDSSTTAFCTGFERPGTPHLDERKQNAKDIYNRNKGKKAPSTSSVASSSNQIIKSAKEIKTYISSNGYKYGALGVQVKNAKLSKTVDCSSYVSWVLFNAGYIEFGGWQQTDVSFYANSWGFKEVKKSEVKPGDILIYSGHVEIYMGMEEGTTKVYNAGSNNSIRNPGVTNSSRGLNAATKILRPSK